MRVEWGDGELKFHSPEEAASEICAGRSTGPVKISGEEWHGPHNHARCVMGATRRCFGRLYFITAQLPGGQKIK